MEAAELPTPPAAAPSSQPSRLLGELLVAAGALRAEHLEQALAEQKQAPHRRIGEILVARGFVSSKTLAQALAHQHGLEFVDLARVEVEPAATSLLPEQFARKAQVLPVRFLAKDLVQLSLIHI